jgi:hypothetical protein
VRLPQRPVIRLSCAGDSMSTSVPAVRAGSGARDSGLASWYTAGGTDGFGDRLLMFDNSGAASFELLRFRQELAVEAGFESLLRQRVQRLATFRHPSFPSIKAVEHLEDGDGLALVSTHTPGKRLSELLDSRTTSTGLHPAFVSWLVQQITPLLATLQSHGYDIVHGALTIDRIILTPEGRIAIVEHALGSAVRGLEMSPARLWREFGIVARPTSRGEACLDARGDIMQVGVVALSLLLGRRVALQEVEQRLPALFDEFSLLPSARASLFTPPLRQWLERAMQVHPQSYRSAAEAHDGLRELPAQAVSSLPALLGSLMGGAPVDVPPPAALPVAVIDDIEDGSTLVVPEDSLHAEPEQAESVTLPVAETTPAASPAAFTVTLEQPATSELATLLPPAAADISRVDIRSLEVARMDDPGSSPYAMAASRLPDRSLLASTRRWVMIGLALIAIIEAAVIAALVRRPTAPVAAAVAAPLAITIDASRPGSTVFVDDRPAGTTPLSLTLDATTRSLRITDTVAAGTTVAAPVVAPVAGAEQTARQLPGAVRFTSPIDLQIFEGARLLGRTLDGAISVPPGTHQFDLVNADLGFRTRQSVTVRTGETSAFTVAMPTGRLSVNAQPWAQVWVDQNAVGETPIANLSVSLGQHEVTFRHPQLGERKETVVIRADRVTRLSATFNR